MTRSPRSRLAAITVAVAVAAMGMVVSAPAMAESTTGTISGHFVNRAGTGLQGYEVRFTPEACCAESTYTDFAGSFSKELSPGRYRVSFSHYSWPEGSFTQYHPGTDVYVEAAVVDLAAGQTISIEEVMYPTGRISGSFTDADGAPMSGVYISAFRGEDGLGVSHYSMTDADGQFSLNRIRVSDSWRIRFEHWETNLQQYAFGAVRRVDAALISVAEGQTSVVDDQRLPTGSVRVLVRDAVSGEPVPSFDVVLGEAGYGSGQDGVVEISSVPVGTHPVKVTAAGYKPLADGQTVRITAGEMAEITVALQPKMRIKATVLDAATGEPVVGVCLVPAKPQHFQLPDGCDSVSSPTGKVFAEIDAPGWYQVLAFPAEAPGYGAQWVGSSRGSGSQLDAQLIKVEDGEIAEAPVVKMERAGRVTGTVTNPDGTPAAWGTVSIGSFDGNVGPGMGTTSIDEEGNYTISFLGPYRWPLQFWRSAVQFSGGTAHRHLAERVAVASDQTTTYDFRFRQWVELNATITGIPQGYCVLTAFNALTGDLMMQTWVDDCSQRTRDIAGFQAVKFRLSYDDGNEFKHRWYGGDDFHSAKTFLIPSSGSKSVTLNF